MRSNRLPNLAIVFGLLLLPVALWLPYGLNTGFSADDWAVLANADLYKINFSIIPPARPLVMLPWWGALLVSPQSLIGANLLALLLMFGRGIVSYAIWRRVGFERHVAYAAAALAIVFPVDQGVFYFGALSIQVAVVAFLIIIPTLASGGRDLAEALAIGGLKAGIALTLILFLGQRPMRAWFTVVVRLRSSELFVLNVLLVTLGLAGLTQLAGLSLGLGAFLAGMLIAETEFRYEVEEDIKPFRDVLLGLFFVTVGMSLDPGVAISQAGLVLLLLVAPVLAKLALIVVLARAFGSPLATALRTGFYLAQAGELALVMMALGADYGYTTRELTQAVLAAMLLSMLSAPLLIQFAEPIVRRLTANDWLARAAQLTQVAARAMARQDHVIVCGYGRSGQNLVRLLEKEDIAYVALDVDPERVREAAEAGSLVVYGDATRREVLVSAGLHKARALVITFADTPVALRILHHVQSLRHELPVIVRTLDDSEIDKLVAAGATEVVPEILEGSLMLASHSLMLVGVPLNRVLRNIREIREERYGLFRGFFHGVTDAADAAENLQPRLHTVVLPDRAYAVGRTLDQMRFDGMVEVTGVRRRGGRSQRPPSAWQFEPGDAVVLLGRPGELSKAEERLLSG